ncbi:MAG: alpha/beta hydrolase [Elusimicrobiota bacterium]|nr:alpha/beta hydrolase [Elusimicrobiota bacterium]
MKKFFKLLPALVLLPCALGAAENITIDTEDEWTLSALYEPSENGRYVIMLHELGKNKDEFAKLENKIKNAGYGFIALDLRGHGSSINKGEYKTFAKTGTDNEFNQMVRDVTAAIGLLNNKDIPTRDIYLAGSGLGANVAAKSLIFNPDIAGIALFTPSLKTRDVLTMNGIKINTKPVFIAVSSEDRKQMMEASFIRNAAFLSSGEGNVVFMTAYNLKGSDMVDKYLSEEFLQWLAAPQRPPVLPDDAQEIILEVPAAPQL